MPDDTEIHGVEEIVALTKQIPLDMRKGFLRNALAAGARILRDDAKKNAPVLNTTVAVKGRKSGTVRDALAVRTSKQAKAAGDVGVFVNVKPAKGASRGANNPNDPFYWQWLEFGRKARAASGTTRAVGAIAPKRFLSNSAAKFPEALAVVEASLRKQMAKYEKNNP